MKTIKVNTGFGYFKNAAGKITDKAELPPGDHPQKDGYTYTEVADQAALDAVTVYQDPADLQAAEYEKKIRDQTRSNAVDVLKAAGQLPADFED